MMAMSTMRKVIWVMKHEFCLIAQRVGYQGEGPGMPVTQVLAFQ